MLAAAVTHTAMLTSDNESRGGGTAHPGFESDSPHTPHLSAGTLNETPGTSHRTVGSLGLEGTSGRLSKRQAVGMIDELPEMIVACE